MRNMGLGRKLIVGGVLVISIPMLLVSAFLISRTSSILTDFSETMTTQTVEKLTSGVRTILEKEIVQTKGFSAMPSVLDICTKAKMNGRESVKEDGKVLNQELYRILKQLGDQYSGIFIADTTGRTLAGILSNGDTKAYEVMDISDRDYFKAAQKDGKAEVGSIVKSKATNKPVMTVFSPVKSEKGEFLGVFVVSSKIDLLINVVAGTKVGRTGYAFMLDDKGIMVAHPKPEHILELNATTAKGLEELARRMTAQEKGILSYNFEGKDEIGAFAPVGLKSWSIAVVQPKDELLGQVTSFRNQGILIGLGLLGIALILILFFGKSVSKPIAHVVAGLSESADQVSVSSGQVSSSSQQLAEGASKQAAAIEETSSSLEEMSSMTRQNAENADQANKLMAETKETVARAGRSMEMLTSSMSEISRAGEETSKIIRTIDEIAFQTNLLALNAAVEAARAGEAGAGFAVVADEVRNLALRAAEAAKNTAGLIEGSVRKVKEGSELVEKTEKEFREVAASVGKSSELIGEISAASYEQSQGIGQVNKAVGDMDKVVQQNASSAEESAAASEEMSSQAQRMKAFVNELLALVGGNAKESQGSRAKRSENRTEPGNGNPEIQKTVILAESHKNHKSTGKGEGHKERDSKADARKMIPFSKDEMEDF